jgi:hypothetical protein
MSAPKGRKPRTLPAAARLAHLMKVLRFALIAISLEQAFALLLDAQD